MHVYIGFREDRMGGVERLIKWAMFGKRLALAVNDLILLNIANM
jgi:hypothetical protein